MGMQFIEGYREANLPKRGAATNQTPDTKIPTTVKEDTRWPNEPTGTTPPLSATTSLGGITPKIDVGKEKTEQPEMMVAQRQVTLQATHVSSDGLEVEEVMVRESTLNQAMASMQSDAPACPNCGATTVRSGTCYKCLVCGDSLGCS